MGSLVRCRLYIDNIFIYELWREDSNQLPQNWPVQSQKQAEGFKFRIYCEVDLCLCFRTCKLFFLMQRLLCVLYLIRKIKNIKRLLDLFTENILW